MKKIAVLGATGYVGSELVAATEHRGYQAIPISRSDCDIYDVDALTGRLREIQPDFLVNCAGYTGKPNVDACEIHRTECLAGNGVLPGIVSNACSELNLRWGHVSSGCIYTGRRDDGAGFTELDPPNFSFRQNNCSFYSGSKALGEEVLQDDPRCYIWRLRIPFSDIDSPRNFLSKVMNYDRLLDAENSLSCLPDFVNACLQCFELNAEPGIYNLTNPGDITTREVVQLIQESGVCTKEFQFFESETEFMRLAAKTPRSNCILDSSKAIKAGLGLRNVREAIRSSLQHWKTKVEC